MKKTIITLAVATMALLGASSQAEARDRGGVYVSGYSSCGTPVYRERYLVGYDCHGREIWGTRSARQQYRPTYRPSYRQVEYRRRAAPCPPPPCDPYPRDHSHGGGQIVFEGSFDY